MAIILAGSEGETKREILSALQLPTDIGNDEIHNAMGRFISSCFESTPGVTVSVGNRVFVRQETNVIAQYQELLSKNYGAGFESVDFRGATEAVRKHINGWISNETKGKIQNLFTPGSLDPATCVLIANALYFKGAWQYEFNKLLTREAEFHLLNGERKKIKMMFEEKFFEYATLSDLNAVAVKMPFRESRWKMLIVLPNEHDGLNTLLPKLQSGQLKNVLDGQFDRMKVDLFLPRFKLNENRGIDVVKLLGKLGINSVFSFSTANLQRICEREPLFVSAVNHKAILEVDEEGATAAATTYAIMTNCYRPPSPPPIIVRVDHPFFLSLIYDDKIPVFLGHVTDPEVN
ncbi:unnamed protein product [Echinostoma caproni]|uniref:SERPIN domain-containing protein n=1 Tax=Echinostoma caproni TaxID=27848 RepID=A0A183AWX3_9TREM|nr:unnamed protein product [Echinostoma caproni]